VTAVSASRRGRSERGAATAELAMVLPALVAITIGLVWLLSVGFAQVRTLDAAREAARALARGDPEASARAVGEQVAPPGSTLTIAEAGDRVTVTAAAGVKGPGGLFAFLPAVTVHAQAVALLEPT
jgi:hypothetical protein